MEHNNAIEAMLVELVEQANGQKEQSGKVMKKLDGIDERLTRLESAEPPTSEQVSMITLKDYQEKVKAVEAEQTQWILRYEKAKKEKDALQAERPYWATKVWPVKVCKWLYLRRHWWGLTAHAIYTVVISVFIFVTFSQCSEISDLRDTQMKYRFINAGGYAPQAVQFLEDAYEERHKGKIDFIERTVSDYEKALKHKADSIARAERKKLERF